MKPRYQRVLLKISGEALMGDREFGISPEVIETIAQEIADVHASGVELALVIGGGNIFRGAAAVGMDRVTADHVGMLATLMNCLAMQEALERHNIDTRVLSALTIDQVAEPFVRRRALRHLEKGRLIILAAGTGNPYFTTDSAAALRAMEIKADVLLKATKVDGVFTADPVTHPEARHLAEIDYLDVIEQDLRVMDGTAITLCMENDLPIVIFSIRKAGNLQRVIAGERIGSIVSRSKQ